MNNENKFGLKGAINMPPKKELKKNQAIEIEKTEKAIQILHSTKEKVVRISLDVPENMYPELKIQQIKKGFKTTRDYLLDLVTKDIRQ